MKRKKKMSKFKSDVGSGNIGTVDAAYTKMREYEDKQKITSKNTDVKAYIRVHGSSDGYVVVSSSNDLPRKKMREINKKIAAWKIKS